MVVLRFRSLTDIREAIDSIKAWDWLCKAVRRGTSKETRVSKTSYNLELCERTHSKRVVRISGHLGSTHSPEIEKYCWIQLFQSWTMVISRLGPRIGFGKGLEMSFDLMLSLAAAEFAVVVAGGVVFVGYRTILFPTAIHENSAQFHLFTGGEGQINPYVQEYGSRVLTENATQFRKMRCFLGWCTKAHVNLGTKRLPLSIRYSGGADKGKSIKLDGYTTTVQVGASAPLSAVLGVQSNFTYLSHQLRFTPASNYTQLLYDTAREVSLVYDSRERRCWLVPKLSLLLHMSQVYASHCGCAKNQVPWVEPHSNAVDLVKHLEALGGTPILGNGDDAFLFRQLMLGLNTNLLKTVDLVKPSGGRKLYGFEFMDIITQPGRGSCMKKLDTAVASKAWIGIANAVDAVIVCAGLGDAITAADEARTRNKNCGKVPPAHDYLAATISCLGRLIERKGGALFGKVEGQRLQISDKCFWDLFWDPFSICNHCSFPGECWTSADIFQNLTSWPMTLINRRKTSGKTQPLSTAIPIPTSGAVVFGTPP